MPAISDRDSAAGLLEAIGRLVNRVLDLDHPDRSYQASKARLLAGYAADLAHDFELLADSQRIRIHLGLDHGHPIPDRDQLDHHGWLTRHQGAHHPRAPMRTTHAHQPDDPLLNPQPTHPADRR